MAAHDEWAALKEKNIHVGDWVSIRIRGGHQEGYVTKIATSTDETPHPPKVPPCCGGGRVQRIATSNGEIQGWSFEQSGCDTAEPSSIWLWQRTFTR